MRDPATTRARVYALAITRLIAALALLATGGIHLEQYIVAYYRDIPAIGPLFLLNFIAGTILGLYFLVPARANRDRVRWWVDTSAALAGWTVGAGGLVALLVSEHTPLFGFMEHGYRLEIVIAIVAEGVTVVALGAFLGLSRKAPGQGRRVGPRSDSVISASSATESS